jgi:hypothetical protein
MPIISRQIIARSVPAIAGSTVLNVTDHYGRGDELQYLASEGLDVEAGLPALFPNIANWNRSVRSCGFDRQKPRGRKSVRTDG